MGSEPLRQAAKKLIRSFSDLKTQRKGRIGFNPEHKIGSICGLRSDLGFVRFSWLSFEHAMAKVNQTLPQIAAMSLIHSLGHSLAP
jgi:hypothetical protein